MGCTNTKDIRNDECHDESLKPLVKNDSDCDYQNNAEVGIPFIQYNNHDLNKIQELMEKYYTELEPNKKESKSEPDQVSDMRDIYKIAEENGYDITNISFYANGKINNLEQKRRIKQVM